MSTPCQSGRRLSTRHQHSRNVGIGLEEAALWPKVDVSPRVLQRLEGASLRYCQDKNISVSA
jgi:hypothetical protein